MGHRLLRKYGDRLRTVYDLGAGRVRMTVGDNKRAVVGDITGSAVAADEAATSFNGVDAVPIVYNKDLPDNDLLAAIHSYASAYAADNNLEYLYTAFDETALLAMAVVLEERIDELLGENGHLVYAQEPGLRGSSDDDSDAGPKEIDSEGLEIDNILMMADDADSDNDNDDDDDDDDDNDDNDNNDESDDDDSSGSDSLFNDG